MFCKNCGKEIDDNAVICPNCGVQVAKIPTDEPRKEGNAVAIVGFIFAFLMPIVGLICSIVGFNNCKKYNAPYKNLAIAGIIISIVVWVLAIIIEVAVSAAAAAAMSACI